MTEPSAAPTSVPTSADPTSAGATSAAPTRDPTSADPTSADPTSAGHTTSTVRRAFAHSGRPPVPPGTPAEVADTLTWEPRKPIPLPRPIPTVPASGTPTGRHRLVVLGDSVGQGFQSLAAHQTALSWPALLAHYGGIEGFRFPVFPGPAGCPGLPLNLESLFAALPWPASVLDAVGDIRLLADVRRILDDVEDYWERGPGDDLVRAAPAVRTRELPRVPHNLSTFSFDLRDAMSFDVQMLRARIAAAPSQGDAVFAQLPSASIERSALLTLAGGEAADTAVSLARALGDDGGIETLVVALGANNMLRTLLRFAVVWSGPGYDDIAVKRQYTAWTPEHFRSEFDALLTEVETIAARNVIVFTVPHVTIAPMLRGVGERIPGDRYFARYTRPWITDAEFNANQHPVLTGDQLRVLDHAVDLYNAHIATQVAERNQADQQGRRWVLLDVAGLLDRLAFRRYLIDDDAQPDWWTPYDLPDAYRALSPVPDSRLFRSDKFGRTEGGLFSLDAVHPTTTGYALVAREVMSLMTQLEVPLAATEPDFVDVLASDTLLNQPPAHIGDVLAALGVVNRSLDLYRALAGEPPV